jgi:tRNA(adenine34) deaminase
VTLSDEDAVRAALSQARIAAEEGEVPIGAVVLDPSRRVIASRRAGAALGAWRLDGCTLAVTLEPCTMCAGALVLARVARLVFGAWDPKAGAVGSLWDVVRDRRLNHRPEVVAGVCEDECSALLASWFAVKRPR